MSKKYHRAQQQGSSSAAGLVQLDFFVQRRSIPAKSVMWPAISAFQRKGFVCLDWGDNKQQCGVLLTDKGREEVARLQALPKTPPTPRSYAALREEDIQ